ncbi:hypothetical protein SLEP1_g55878 [Rubroshorea leprosula]|uniref:PGG domain-containing protein n=1 Tax=Rubroshorea leprosula TaxID=152421 RepID=A0AAV5MGU8_9ROSI|nr:hypothetical protein SLEP1_g55878 [Rubroshorea leprosula]
MKANQVQPIPSSNAGLVPCIIVPELLKEDNYKRWCIFMQHYLVAQDLWDVVLSSEMPEEDLRDWVRKNALALHAIKISCGTKSFDRIEEMNSAKDAWNVLADLHKQPSETNYAETWERMLVNNERTKFASIFKDICFGNWDALKGLDEITEIILLGGSTVLHVATTYRRLEIVRELVKIAREEYLEIQDNNGDTALSLAACNKDIEIAKCLVQKNVKLLTISNKEGHIPLVVACINRQKEMASYLYSKTESDFLLSESNNHGTLFLKYCALNFMLDVGLEVYLHCPRFAASRESITILELSRQPSLFLSGAARNFTALDILLYRCLSVGKLPSPSDDAVSSSRRGIFRRQLAWVKVMDKILAVFFFRFHRPGMSVLVLRHWCKEISTYTDVKQLVESEAISIIFQTIKQGTYEIVYCILLENADLIWCNDKLARDLLSSVIKHHDYFLLRFVTKFDAGKKALLSLKDKDGNNALHLAAKLPDYHYESAGIDAAWTMASEEQWLKKVKSRLPCSYQDEKNLCGETPGQVFYKEHKELITNMEEWGKKTAESYSLASVLIVTITFAALFTVPGGVDEKTGKPKLLHIKESFGFLMCDAVSFITASTSLFGFLSVLTLTYRRRDRHRALYSQLLFAISTLIISIATMILAFIFALALMLENKWQSRDSKKGNKNENEESSNQNGQRDEKQLPQNLIGDWPNPANPSLQRPGCCQVKGLNRNYDGPHTLFVFGDSYADTGNWKKSFTSSWKLPYGITFPGKPTGRFSDGRVLTDYIASYLDIRSTIPYKFRKIASKSYFRYGMNFAHGGTGVFDTLVKEPNMTVQIDIFQRLVEKKVFKEEYLNSSIALVSVAGNDYSAYVVKNDNDNKNLPAFTTSLIDQLATNLERIHSLGVRKIAVTAIEPMGCLPVATASSSYKNCSKAGSLTSKFHNEILAKAVKMLNEQRKRTNKSLISTKHSFLQ